jgi:hypothetical protein
LPDKRPIPRPSHVAAPACPRLPPCSDLSRTRPSRARKCASLTGPARVGFVKCGPGRRNGLLKPNKETGMKKDEGRKGRNPAPAVQALTRGPHIRMAPNRRAKCPQTRYPDPNPTTLHETGASPLIGLWHLTTMAQREINSRLIGGSTSEISHSRNCKPPTIGEINFTRNQASDAAG